VDGGGPAGHLVELGEFGFCPGEADFQALGLAVPSFAFGLGDAVEQVAVDLGDPRPLGWGGPQEGAAQAAFSELDRFVSLVLIERMRLRDEVAS
jgi:hypothetical protein